MGTTIVLTFFFENNMYLLWAGDSRCYLYRQGQLELITRDHSLVQDLIDEGKLSYAESFFHPERNIVTKSVGGSSTDTVQPEIRVLPYLPGDRVLLCSDGLNGMVVDQRIREIVSAYADLNECAQALIQEANAMGGSDNITVVLAEVL
jgi:protein phosphatase